MLFVKKNKARYALYSKQMRFWLKGTTNMWEITGLNMYQNRMQFAENRRIIYTPRCVIYTPTITLQSVNFRDKFTLQKRVKN